MRNLSAFRSILVTFTVLVISIAESVAKPARSSRTSNIRKDQEPSYEWSLRISNANYAAQIGPSDTEHSVQIEVNPRIKGGQSTTERPFLARIEKSGKHVCSGVIVDRGWLIALRACVQEKYLDSYRILIRPDNYKATKEEIKFRCTAIKTIRKDDKELVLVKLDGEIDPDQVHVTFLRQPITKEEDSSLSKCILVGLEKDQDDYHFKKISIKPLRDRECPRAVQEKTVCFEAKYGKVCPIDSGSPVLCTKGRDVYLRGLYSAGKICERYNLHAVQMSYFADAIVKVIGRHNDENGLKSDNNGDGNDDNSGGNGDNSGGNGDNSGSNGDISGGNGDDSEGNGDNSGGNGDNSGGNGDNSGGNGDNSGGNGDNTGGNGDNSGGNGDNSGSNGDISGGNGDDSEGNGDNSGGNGDNSGGNGDNSGGNGDNSGGNGDNSGGNGDNTGGNGDNSGGNGDNSGGNGDNSGGNGDNSGGNGDNSGGNGGDSGGNGDNSGGNGDNSGGNGDNSGGNNENSGGNGDNSGGNGDNSGGNNGGNGNGRNIDNGGNNNGTNSTDIFDDEKADGADSGDDTVCPKSVNIANGNAVFDGNDNFEIGALATVVCNEGYTTEREMIMCLANGKWEKSKCSKIVCPKSVDIAYGQVVLDNAKNFEIGALATVVCNDGYTTKKELITCLANGEWEKSNCSQIVCAKSVDIAYGQVVLDNANNFEVGALATVVCSEGYEAKKEVLECRENGEWEKSKCSKIDDEVIACDFEKIDYKKCKWESIGKETYAWTRTNGDTNTWKTGPDADHTVGKYWGHYLYLESNAPAAYGDIAKLRFDSIPGSNDYCFTLWYHMYGSHVNYMSISLGDSVTNDTIELSRISGNQGNMWHQAAFKIAADSVPNDFRIEIECQRGRGIRSDYAVDDLFVSRGSCADCGSAPSVSNGKVKLIDPDDTEMGAEAKISCNFGYNEEMERIKCLISGEWEEPVCLPNDCGKVPDVEHGSVMLDDIAVTTIWATATVSCKYGYEPVTATISCQRRGIWEKPKCKKTVCSRRPFVANGIAVLDDYYNFAVDATATIKCSLGNEAEKTSITCLETGEWESAECSKKENVVLACDFEEENSTLCQWNSVGDERYSWTRHHGDTGTWFTGPEADHSLGKYWGHYIFLEANKPARAQDVAKFVLQSVAGNQDYCFRFWYHMYGSQIEFMSVYLEDTFTNGRTELSRISGNQGNTWHPAVFKITADNVPNDFRIVIECQRGPGTKSDYAVDDLIVSEGSCVDCGSAPVVANGKVNLIDPDNTDIGAEAKVKCNIGYNAETERIKCLINGEWENPVCSSNDCGNVPDVEHGNVVLDDISVTTVSATATVSCKYGYEPQVTTISCKRQGVWEKPKCKKTVCSRRPHVTNGVAVLDDYYNFAVDATATIKCSLGNEVEKTSITCLETGEWESAECSKTENVVLACDFEEENTTLCQWNSIGQERYSWTRHHGDTGTWFTGPEADHSLGKYWGHYIFLEANNPAREQDVAKFVLQSVAGNQDYCFRFWYHMYGSQIEYMSVYLEDTLTNGKTVLSRISGNQGNTWHPAVFKITADDVPNDFRIVIECQRGRGTKSDYAVDDLIVSKGSCADCGSAPVFANGKVNLIDPDNTDIGAEAKVSCNVGYNSETERIKCLINGEWENPVCNLNDCGNVPDVEHGNVVLDDVANTTVSATATVKCDDGYEPQVATISCQPQGLWEKPKCKKTENVVLACDFEVENSTLCQWNSVGNERYSWTRHQGDTGTWFTGPDADHSIGKYWGHYVYLEANTPARPRDVANFVLQSVAGNQDYCFRFWYHMYGSKIVYMSVYLEDNTTKGNTELTRILGNQGNRWHQASFNITADAVQNNFMIGIECERGSKTTSDYAIDDLIVTKGLCNVSNLLKRDCYVSALTMDRTGDIWLRRYMNVMYGKTFRHNAIEIYSENIPT